MDDPKNTILPNVLPRSAGKESAPRPTEVAAAERLRRGGRRTPEGKADNWLSALAHGIRSNAPVIPHIEDEDAWRRFHRGIIDYFKPEGVYEEELVYRLAHLSWRLRRVVRYEVMVTMHYIGTTEHDVAVADTYAAGKLAKGPLLEPNPKKVRALQQMRIVADSHELNKIMRYETHLHRLCLQAQHELEALQARRRGEPTHLARLDISATPMG